MFWGLIMEPNKRYTQEVDKSFHVSQAALDVATSDGKPVQLMLTYEKRNYLLGTLEKGKVNQMPLDLNFEQGNKISFTSNGNSHVHLTGYLTPDDPYEGLGESGESELEEEAPVLVPIKKSKRKLSEPEPSTSKSQTKKVKSDLEDLLNNTKGDSTSEDDEDYNPENTGNNSDDLDVDDSDMLDEDDVLEDDGDDDDDDDDDDENDDEEDDDDDDDDEEVDDHEEETTEVKPKEKKPQQNGVESKKDKKNKNKETSDNKEKKTLAGGVMIEDIKVGSGKPAQSGKKIQVYYVGRLKSNNKIFDSAQKGPGFKFALGKGEVIKGWDVGLAGMKVGGKRRLTIPHQMAYGTKGSPPVIPPNSTLIFEVELRNVF